MLDQLPSELAVAALPAILLAALFVVAIVASIMVGRRRRPTNRPMVEVNGLAHQPNDRGSAVRCFYVAGDERLEPIAEQLAS